VRWRRQGVSWKTYVDQLRADDREAVTVALAVADRALTEAKAATNEQFRTLAEKLDRLESRAGGAIPRGETEALLMAMGQRMESNLAAEISRVTATVTEAVQRFSSEVTSLNRTVSDLHDSVAALGVVLTLFLIAAAVYGLWPK
jgi:phage shock protein A